MTETIVFEEGMLQVYDILATFLEQLKSKLTDVENNGITPELSDGVNAIVFSSSRLEIKELEILTKQLRPLMDKVEYKDAMNGA